MEGQTNIRLYVNMIKPLSTYELRRDAKANKLFNTFNPTLTRWFITNANMLPNITIAEEYPTWQHLLP